MTFPFALRGMLDYENQNPLMTITHKETMEW
ncbi:hypothetical protein GLYMA_20G082901v4 [Glycine max]|nr:hypothetical protein GLYMA_20G082901v4 [Glycine max]KAH1035139.1 hypothetical protein GYH30_055217 [Glycine max]